MSPDKHNLFHCFILIQTNFHSNTTWQEVLEVPRGMEMWTFNISCWGTLCEKTSNNDVMTRNLCPSVIHISREPFLLIYLTRQYCCSGWGTCDTFNISTFWMNNGHHSCRAWMDSHLIPLMGSHGEADVNSMKISVVQQPAVVICCSEQRNKSRRPWRVKRRTQSSKVFHFFCQQQ